MFLSNQSFSFQVENFGRKMVELGWESFTDSSKNCWKNCDGNLKSWVNDWKNYWNDGSGSNGLTVSDHYYFSSMRNSGDFSSQDCTFVRKDYCLALKRLHSLVHDIIAELEAHDTPQTHDSCLTVSTARSWKLV